VRLSSEVAVPSDTSCGFQAAVAVCVASGCGCSSVVAVPKSVVALSIRGRLAFPMGAPAVPPAARKQSNAAVWIRSRRPVPTDHWSAKRRPSTGTWFAVGQVKASRIALSGSITSGGDGVGDNAERSPSGEERSRAHASGSSSARRSSRTDNSPELTTARPLSLGGLVLRDLAIDPSRIGEVPADAVPELLADLVALGARLCARLTTPATPTTGGPPRLLTVQEVAGVLGVPPGYVYELTRTAALPSVRFGKYVRVAAAALETWMTHRQARDRLTSDSPAPYRPGHGARPAAIRTGTTRPSARASSP
jgi:excisionase family DNA binding protein